MNHNRPREKLSYDSFSISYILTGIYNKKDEQKGEYAHFRYMWTKGWVVSDSSY